MSTLPVNIPLCHFIKPDGRRCGSPALRNRRLCFFHSRLRPRMLRHAQAVRRRYLQLVEQRGTHALTAQ